MAMKNSLCRCRVLAKIATSQPTTRRIPPSITLLLQQSSCYSTDKKEHSPPTTTPKNTPPLYKKSPSSTDFPRPKEIPFQAKVANSINLIGYIDMPIQTLVSSHGGKFTAATVITQEPSYHSPALRIPIIFEGDLAHIAASHLKKGDFVKIGGQLSTDPPPFPEMQDQTQVLVLGNSINFVEGSFQMKKSLLEQQPEGPLDDDVSMKRNGESGSNSWTDLLENPDKWWDYRSSKLSGLVKPKHPDFKHKNNGQPVWLSGAPSWIFSGLKKVKFDVKTVLPTQTRQQKGLEKVKFDVKTVLPAQTRQQKEEGFWKDLVENPNKWWDNRFNKKNPKSPDFKHKETGEGLWLDTSPAWVLPKLPPTKGAENVAGTWRYNSLWGQGST